MQWQNLERKWPKTFSLQPSVFSLIRGRSGPWEVGPDRQEEGKAPRYFQAVRQARPKPPGMVPEAQKAAPCL